MNITNFFKSKKNIPELKDTKPETKSIAFWPGNFGVMGGGSYGGSIPPVVQQPFSGEKTPGELGVVIQEIPMYELLRLRAYSAYIKTDIVKILASKRFQWVIGSGLDIEIEPNTDFLEISGITLPDNFRDVVEARWNVYINSVYVDYERKKSLHKLAKDFHQDEFLGGDCLCVCRIEKEGLSVQFISGEKVKNPGLEVVMKVEEDGNYIMHGIEFNSRGQEVAYYVHKKSSINSVVGLENYERIEVYGKNSNRKLAWMIYGQKINPDHKRGIPEITQILEKVVKLDRYTEAGVSKAEQGANIVYSIEHDKDGTGEDIVETVMKRRMGLVAKVDGETAEPEITDWQFATGIGDKIQQSTSGTTVNLPPGAKLNSFSSDIESKYGDFMTPNLDMVFASTGTPPEVALQKYNSNYSASRAAINSWAYVVDIDRKDFADQFYKPVYSLWLEVEILSGRINAPGYIVAADTNDFMVVEAYSGARFIGKNMPHIDPLKEANAIRALLGDKTKGEEPLISFEQAVETLGFGNWWENIVKYANEQEELKKRNINATIDTNSESGSGLDGNQES